MAAHNLPTYAAPFIGREEELSQISALLQEPICRLLTLIGPGGIGKTRLALEVASHITMRFADGVFFVPLQPLHDVDDIVTTIIAALPLQLTDLVEPRSLLLNYLREKHLLLLLDNFEHLLAGVDIVTDILNAATQVELIVTSRECLNLQVEQLWPVRGLDVPNVTEDVSEMHSAVRLFVERARRVQPDFSFNIYRDSVIRICRLVDGLPLALELAASWVRALSCETIADEIQHNIDILATNRYDVPERHRSMRATFDHSWQLLGENERAAFRKLSVFRGGFTAEAAEHIAGASLRILAASIDKSLVQLDDEGRYNVHELLRQYAEEQLELAGEKDATLNAHSEHYALFMYEREFDLKGTGELQALSDIRKDFENIRNAWQQAVWQHQVHLIASASESLCIFCKTQGRYREGIALLLQARDMLAQVVDTNHSLTWARVLIRHLHLTRFVHPLPSAPEAYQALLAVAEAALEITRQHHNLVEIAYCLKEIGQLEAQCHNYERAVELYDESLALFATSKDSYYTTEVMLAQEHCFGVLGQIEKAYDVARLAVTPARATGNSTKQVDWLSQIAWFRLYVDGDFDTAQQNYAEAFDLATKLEYWPTIGLILFHTGLIALLRGNFEQAAILGNEGLELGKQHYIPVSIGFGNVVTGLAASLLGDPSRGMQLIFNGRQRLTNPPQRFFADLGIAVAACGVEADETLSQHLVAALEFAARLRSVVYRLISLPCAAVYLERNHQLERAVEALALAFTHPKSPTGWLEKWPLIARLHADLVAALGKETFTTAWERGKTLDLESAARKLLAEMKSEQAVRDSSINQSLVDPLSPRELEVLALLTEGFTNREIADRLFVGVSTVKKHINHIYSKLDVTDRTEAVKHARALGLFL